MTSVLAFDPGETTGWALVKDGMISGGVFPRWSLVQYLIDSSGCTVVVAEDFRLYRHLAPNMYGQQIYTLRVLGVIEYLAQSMGKPFVLQEAHKKSLKLAKIPAFTGQGEHPYDALQHALVFLKSGGQLAPEYAALIVGINPSSVQSRTKRQTQANLLSEPFSEGFPARDRGHNGGDHQR